MRFLPEQIVFDLWPIRICCCGGYKQTRMIIFLNVRHGADTLHVARSTPVKVDVIISVQPTFIGSPSPYITEILIAISSQKTLFMSTKLLFSLNLTMDTSTEDCRKSHLALSKTVAVCLAIHVVVAANIASKTVHSFPSYNGPYS